MKKREKRYTISFKDPSPEEWLEIGPSLEVFNKEAARNFVKILEEAQLEVDRKKNLLTPLKKREDEKK